MEEGLERGAVETQQAMREEEGERVLKSRRGSWVHPPGRRGESSGNLGKSGKQAQPEDDLARYERDQDEPDDFRLRMLANVAAFAFTVALTAIGIWLAMSIADLRKTQDCVLMGRRDCAHISAPHI